MRSLKILFLLLLTVSTGIKARECRDTLVTGSGDNFIVPYDVIIDGDVVCVRLRPAIKRLGQETSRKYRKPEELTLLFFDRNGSFQDAVFSGDVIPEAFRVPADAAYTPSQEGYYTLHDNPEIKFRLSGGSSDFSCSVPLFLAHHPNRGRYKLISRCGALKISASKPVVKLQSGSGQKETIQRSVTSTVEIESDNTEMTQVLECVKNINDRLPLEDRLPFSESLQRDVQLLMEWKYSVKDRNLKNKVNETLNAYENRKRQLEDAKAEAQRAEQARAAEDQKRAVEDQKKEAEAAEKARQEETEKTQKRNIFMIIFGGIAAIGAFFGNQALQNKRSAKNQKNLMDMQRSITKEAENSAKRRVNGIVRSKTSKIVGQTRRKAQDAVRQGVGNTLGKAAGKAGKNKNFTI